MYEDLDDFWDELEPRLKAQFRVFFPSALTWDHPIAEWSSEDGIDGFLEFAESLGVPVIYVIVERFDDESLGELETRLLYESEGPNPQIASIVQKASDYVGKIASIDIGWMFQGVGHFCNIEAEWSRGFAEDLADERSLDAMDVEANRLLLQEMRRLVPEWAGRVAGTDGFSRTKSLRDRIDVVCEVIPELQEAREVREFESRVERVRRGVFKRLAGETATMAQRIFENEIRPVREKQLAKEAHALLAQGSKKYEVAGRLGLSKETLNRIIYQYPSEDD
jgi:hypothetical protein